MELGTVNDSIRTLRRKSRELLNQVKNNGKEVDVQLEKVCSKTSHKSEHWKQRNDSSGVGNLLAQGQSVVPCETSSFRQTIPPGRNKAGLARMSAHHQKHSDERNCYCCVEPVRKIKLVDTVRSRNKATSPCRSQSSSVEDLVSEVGKIPKDKRENASSPPMSCETLRRIQKINYVPRSQYLRNAMGKLSISTPNIPTARDRKHSPRIRGTNVDHHRAPPKATCTKCDCKFNSENVPYQPTSHRFYDLPKPKRRTSSSKKFKCSKDNNNKRKAGFLLSRRATVSSTKRDRDISVRSSTSKSMTRDLHKVNCCWEGNDNFEDDQVGPQSDVAVKNYETCAENNYCSQTGWSLMRQDDKDVPHAEERLHVFRERNYFDTHGSSRTLLPDTCGMEPVTLKQYVLNDRLFPEEVGRVRREELSVLSLPACTTMQNKCVHYLPRAIVKQEKSMCNTNYTRRRHPSCPLTGHAIDLGANKPRYPNNSLALKHQKRVA